MQGHIAENLKISVLSVGASDSVDCDVVDTSKFNHGAFVIICKGANDTDLTLTLYESDDVGKSNTAAVTTACPLYEDVWGTTSDVVAAVTAAYATVIDPATEGSYLGIMEIDPSILSQGYPCVYLDDSSGHGSNTTVILWIGDPKVKGQTLESAVA